MSYKESRSEGLPQYLGALDIYDEDPKMAQAGFEVARTFEQAQRFYASTQTSSQIVQSNTCII